MSKPHNFLGNERVGLKFLNKHGTQYVVTHYENTNKVTIQFLDDYGYSYTTSWNRVFNGSPINPYDRTIVGVGYLGLHPNGEKPKTTHGSRKSTKEYTCWSDMIRRCYDEKYWVDNPTYKNCSVCERWHCFANFLEDIKTIQGYEEWINNSGWEIDKDLLQRGIKNKIYSPQTCIFIPQPENTSESARRTSFGKNNSEQCVVYNDVEEIPFNSIKEAAKFLGVTRQHVSKMCKLNKPYNGYYVKKVVR